MINYDIEETADQLLLSTNELKEILDVYFEENVHLLSDCYKMLTNQQQAAFKKMMHSLKGASTNLRLIKIAAMAEQMEEQAIVGIKEELLTSLEKIQEEIEATKEYIDAFYSRAIK